MATIKDLRDWLDSDLSRFCDLKSNIEVMEEDDSDTHLYIFTERHHFSISASNPVPEAPDGRLYGMLVWPMDDEDLSDGPLTRETWTKILGDIVSVEMGSTARPVRSMKPWIALLQGQPERY